MGVGGGRQGPQTRHAEGALTALLDTHFLIWVTIGSARLAEFPWLEKYQPWGVSPVSLLEIQFLAEVGRLEVRNPSFTEAVLRDQRLTVDEVPLLALVRNALDLSWTRDPFDRLLAAHSSARRVPLCTADRLMRVHHRLLVSELRG